MKKTTFLSLILIAVSLVLSSTTHSYAQTPVPSWSECLGGNDNDRGFSICHVGAVHSILICGMTMSTDLPRHGDPQYADALVIKKDENGDTIFLKTYGGLTSDILSKGIELPNGNFAFAGTTSSPDKVTHGQICFCGDVWILITDSMGNILVDTAYGGSYNDGAADLVYHNGYIYVAGQTFSSDYDFPSGDGTRNGFVMKLDTNGIFVSSNTYGGTLDDAFESITSLSSGYLAVNGWTESIDGDIIGNHGPSLNSDMFFCKVNTNLDLISTLCVGSTGSENGYSVIESGGAIFLGGCGQAAVNGDVTQIFGYPDICVAKLDTLSSSVLWCTMYGGTKYEFGGFLTEALSGNIFVAGSSMSTDGQVLSSTNTAFFEYDAWLFLVDQSGVLQWEVSFGTTGNDESKGVLPLDFDNFIAVGSCRGALDNPYTPYAGGVYDMFLQGSFLPFQPPRSMLATNIQDGPTLSSIAIHPNPTSSMVRITMPPETTTNTVTIYNISGQVLFSEQTSEVVYTTDLTQFSQGTYVVEVKNSTGVFRDRVQKL